MATVKEIEYTWKLFSPLATREITLDTSCLLFWKVVTLNGKKVLMRGASQLAFYVNLHRAVIGPSATLTGRWRPDIDLRRMLTGILLVFLLFWFKKLTQRTQSCMSIRFAGCSIEHCEACFSRTYCTRCTPPFVAYRGDCIDSCPDGLYYANYSKDCRERGMYTYF